MDTPTIVAIASPPGSGGIGIIKISGPDAIKIATLTFRQEKNSNSDKFCNKRPCSPQFQSHHLYYGYIVDPHKCVVLDEVILIVMRAPRSYTCEDVVEIQAHSGPAVCAMNVASTRVTDNVTMPTKTPLICP